MCIHWCVVNVHWLIISCHFQHALQSNKKHRGRNIGQGMYVGLFMLPYQINISHYQNSTYTYLICRKFILSICEDDYITRAEEAILHWSGRISTTFECMKKCSYPYRCTGYIYIALSIISMQGMLMLGNLGAYPQENFEKQILWQ